MKLLQSMVEREATVERMHRNKLQLGQYEHYRHGLHYEQKWVEGVRFEDLER